MGNTDTISVASCSHKLLQVTTPAIQRAARLGHLVAPFKQLVYLLSRQPFAALSPVKVVQQHLKYLYIRM